MSDASEPVRYECPCGRPVTGLYCEPCGAREKEVVVALEELCRAVREWGQPPAPLVKDCEALVRDWHRRNA